MITKHTRDKLRQAAIKNKLGGDTKNRQEFDDESIIKLSDRYKSQTNQYYSPLDDSIYNSRISWLAHLSAYMNNESLRAFQLSIEPKNCKFCEVGLTRNNWQLKNDSMLSPYCRTCYQNKIWKTKASHDKHGIEYGHKVSEKKKAFYQTTRGAEVRKSIAQKNSEHRTRFYSTIQGKQYLESYGKHMSKIMSAKVQSGEFTPCVKNSKTQWAVQVDIDNQIYKFRSTWEACVWISNKSWEYESIRIPYTYNNKTKIYIADFVDNNSKILYEVKPVAFLPQFKHKEQSAKKWCEKNGYQFVILTENNIMNVIDITKFSEHNMALLERLRRGVNAHNRHKIN